MSRVFTRNNEYTARRDMQYTQHNKHYNIHYTVLLNTTILLLLYHIHYALYEPHRAYGRETGYTLPHQPYTTLP